MNECGSGDSLTSLLLYRRADCAVRGRHLVSSCDIAEGRLILAERPLLALQSLENLAYNQVCHGCQAFTGGPDASVLRRRRRRLIGGTSAAVVDGEEETFIIENDGDDDDEAYLVVPCRTGCGHVYCSAECESDTWIAHHRYLCTGRCVSDEHPLVQFKRFAVSTNEILLLVAEWWVVQHATTKSNESAAAARYTDFVMNPWWDVVTADLIRQPGGFGEAAALQTQLRDICDTAAKLLNDAMVALRDDGDHHSDTTSAASLPPPITALDIAVRIGACEQNAMGIRQRNPLCRDMFDVSFRHRRHADIVHCLEETGFIGNCCDDEGETEVENSSFDDAGLVPETTLKEEVDEIAGVIDEGESAELDTEELDYSVEEIALFLSNLYLNEDFSLRNDRAEDRVERDMREEREGDDLDLLFPPLDGTAMYSTACKMNHSCDPNVILVYKRQPGWGAKCPLTAFCVALRDIREGEELTISYTDAGESYKQRQAALVNYGFQCCCIKCQRENPAGIVEEVEQDQTEIDDDEMPEREATSDEDGGSEIDHNRENELGADGEKNLQLRLERLDSAANFSKFGAIPLSFFGPVSAFVIQTANLLISDNRGLSGEDVAVKLLEHCITGVQERDFCLCKIAGCDLEATLFIAVKLGGRWQCAAYREAYFCGALAASLGYIHEYNFIKAQNTIDKALILGLPRLCVGNFVDFIEVHAAQMSVGPYTARFALTAVIADYRVPELSDLVRKEGLSQPIRFPVEEMELLDEVFQSEQVLDGKPCVIRNFAANWPAVTKWRNLEYLAREHGHRLVPIGVGIMVESTMGELTMFRRFLELFLSLSSRKEVWSLSDCNKLSSEIPFIAQHPLTAQIMSLQSDLDMQPELNGSQVNVCMCLGGTRTRLRYDMCSNIFIQLVGASYVRLYNQKDSPNLYISKSSVFGSQGSYSDVDCEQEDWKQHPKARAAVYTELLLNPGDCLFVPNHTWYYSRSLSTSSYVKYCC